MIPRLRIYDTLDFSSPRPTNVRIFANVSSDSCSASMPPGLISESNISGTHRGLDILPFLCLLPCHNSISLVRVSLLIWVFRSLAFGIFPMIREYSGFSRHYASTFPVKHGVSTLTLATGAWIVNPSARTQIR